MNKGNSLARARIRGLCGIGEKGREEKENGGSSVFTEGVGSEE